MLALLPQLVHAALGQDTQSIAQERSRTQARHKMLHRAGFALHELHSEDGSRVRQFVSDRGRVFAVTWNAMHKPDLSTLLGAAYPAYSDEVQAAARRRGVQHAVHHQSADLIVQSNGHLHIFTGYAYHPSMLPAGFDLAQLAKE